LICLANASSALRGIMRAGNMPLHELGSSKKTFGNASETVAVAISHLFVEL
jgi:hypothetical protein